MLVDARGFPANAGFDCDVAIVGAGPAGLTVALELMGSGLSVMVLEAGDGGKTDLDPFHGEVADLARHPPLTLYRSRGLGGTSAMWGGRCVPFDPIDFEPRAHIPWTGWPIDYDELLPWYHRAVGYCEAGPFRFRVAEALGPDAAPMVPGFASPDVEIEGLERFSPPTHFGRRYRRLLAGAPDITVVQSATCVAIRRAASGLAIESLDMAIVPGRRFGVRARAFVLAAGGLETTRLLLANDIGNSRGLVGRFYMCHLEGKAAKARFHPATRVAYHYERDPKGVYLRRFFSFPAETQRRHRMTNVILRFEPPPVADPAHGSSVLSALYLSRTLLRPEYARMVANFDFRNGGSSSEAGRVARHIGNVLRKAPDLALFAADWARRHWMARRKLPYVAVAGRDFLSLDYNAEQVPNPDSRVTLADTTDAFGLPRLKIDWRASAVDVEGVVTAHRLLAAGLEKSGVGRLEVDEEAIRDGYKAMASHHVGTARMAGDCSRGVVDSHCRVFGLDNLYVASAAVFPTSSHANPTLTIVALAARLAEHLKGLAVGIDRR
jgi:choline dehydrogenase-like flavoprotein